MWTLFSGERIVNQKLVGSLSRRWRKRKRSRKNWKGLVFKVWNFWKLPLLPGLSGLENSSGRSAQEEDGGLRDPIQANHHSRWAVKKSKLLMFLSIVQTHTDYQCVKISCLRGTSRSKAPGWLTTFTRWCCFCATPPSDVNARKRSTLSPNSWLRSSWIILIGRCIKDEAFFRNGAKLKAK